MKLEHGKEYKIRRGDVVFLRPNDSLAFPFFYGLDGTGFAVTETGEYTPNMESPFDVLVTDKGTLSIPALGPTFKEEVAIKAAGNITWQLVNVGFFSRSVGELFFDRLTDALIALPNEDLLQFLPSEWERSRGGGDYL